MENIKNWYHTYQVEITWFVIGVLFYSFLLALANGNGIGAMIDLALIYLNYRFWKDA